MKKIISLYMSLVLISLSVTAAASVDISYSQGSTIIKGVVSSGELEYATEATVTVYDEDGNLNYIDIIPVSKDGKAEFSYDNQGKSGRYEFYVDISAFNKTETTTLENFIGNDYWSNFIDTISVHARDKSYDSLKAALFGEKEKGLLDFDISIYDSLANTDNVWKAMAEDYMGSYKDVNDVLNGFYSAVHLCKMNETNDATGWYEAMKESLSSLIPRGENGIVIDEYTKETKAAVLTALASTDYSKNKDACDRLLETALFKAIEKAYHYTDVKLAVQAYYNARYITANPQNITESQYKSAMGASVNSYDSVNRLFVSSGSGGGAGSSGNRNPAPVVTYPQGELESVSDRTDAQSGKMSFSDMEDAKWALKQVELLYEKGIISGTGDGLYDPHRNVTRAEMAKMMVSLAGYDIITCDIPFGDVDKNAWYYPYVCTAYKNGIFTGMTQDTFGINRNITRQEQAAVLYRLLMQKNIEMTQSTEVFADGEKISNWARDAIYSLRHSGIVSGRGGNLFCPEECVTRAEAAVFVANTYNHIY